MCVNRATMILEIYICTYVSKSGCPLVIHPERVQVVGTVQAPLIAGLHTTGAEVINHSDMIYCERPLWLLTMARGMNKSRYVVSFPFYSTNG